MFKAINKIAQEIRWFISENESFFDIAFLALFTLEQIGLLYLIYRFKILSLPFQLAIGMFVLTVVGTATLQKIILNVKNKQLKELVRAYHINYERIINEYEHLNTIIKSKIK